MIKRIVCDIILFLFLLFAPWYWTAVLAIIFMILFRRYWEGVVIAVFFDTLYSLPDAKFYGRFGIFTAVALILFFVLENLKKKIRYFS